MKDMRLITELCGVGMQNAKRALAEAEGNVYLACGILRDKGLSPYRPNDTKELHMQRAKGHIEYYKQQAIKLNKGA